MKDDAGVVQLWVVSPNGGDPRQVTQGEQGIQSAFSWHPQGGRIALVCDNSLMLCEVASGRMQRLTQPTALPPSGDAIVFSPDGSKVAFMREVDGFSQIFVAEV
jgi:Tol biopolymer transport system component